MLRAALALAVVLAACGAAPLAAQQESDAGDAQGPPAPQTAQQVVDSARDKLQAVRERKPCPLGKPGEIVVCAPDPDDLRVPSDLDMGINSHDPVPRAPDLFGIPEGGIVIARGCFIPPCPRKMPPIIDLKAIPEAPPGSDAARYKEDADANERSPAR
jgi:hypothetical protein